MPIPTTKSRRFGWWAASMLILLTGSGFVFFGSLLAGMYVWQGLGPESDDRVDMTGLSGEVAGLAVAVLLGGVGLMIAALVQLERVIYVRIIGWACSLVVGAVVVIGVVWVIAGIVEDGLFGPRVLVGIAALPMSLPLLVGSPILGALTVWFWPKLNPGERTVFLLATAAWIPAVSVAIWASM